MSEEKKTKAQLIDELSKLRQKISSRTIDINLNPDIFWQTEESLRVLMNSNPEAFFLLDTEGKFVAVNEKPHKDSARNPMNS